MNICSFLVSHRGRNIAQGQGHIESQATNGCERFDSTFAWKRNRHCIAGNKSVLVSYKIGNNDIDLSIVLDFVLFRSFLYVRPDLTLSPIHSFRSISISISLLLVRRDEKVIARAISTLRQFRGHRIPRGTYVIPFEFSLPSSLPSSTQFPKVDSRAFNGRIRVSQSILPFLQVIDLSDWFKYFIGDTLYSSNSLTLLDPFLFRVLRCSTLSVHNWEPFSWNENF